MPAADGHRYVELTITSHHHRDRRRRRGREPQANAPGKPPSGAAELGGNFVDAGGRARGYGLSMIVGAVQRWRARQGAYRPAGETIDPRSFEVAPIPDDRTAKSFVLEHHYSGSYPPARRRFGLYRGAELVGVAVFSVPVNARSLDPCPGDANSRAELGRLVLLDDVEANGESWFVARCFESLAREGFTGVVSFADPVPRSSSNGLVIFPGHIGTIYQALNAVFIGRSKPETKLLLPDGTALPARAVAKIKSGDRGWRYAVDRLVEHGADPPDGDRVAWLARELPKVTRRQKHGGNLKYAWALTSAGKRAMPGSKPYPKVLQFALGKWSRTTRGRCSEQHARPAR